MYIFYCIYIYIFFKSKRPKIEFFPLLQTNFDFFFHPKSLLRKRVNTRAMRKTIGSRLVGNFVKTEHALNLLRFFPYIRGHDKGLEKRELVIA